MKRFVMKCIILAILSSLVVTCLFLIPSYKYSYTKGFEYQYHALEKSVDKKRIILLGGSDLAFGVNAKQLEVLSGIPVYLLGIHGGIGMPFILEQADGFVREGDIVVCMVSPFDGEYYGINLIASAFDERPDLLWREVRKRPSLWMKQISNIFVSKINSYPQKFWGTPSMYDARSFDLKGNMIYPRPATIWDATSTVPYHYNITSYVNNGIEMVNSYGRAWTERGAHFFLINSPRCIDVVDNDEVSLSKYDEDMKERFHFPILDSIKDSLVPLSFIFNAAMHLNDEGVMYYTNMLYEKLKIQLI